MTMPAPLRPDGQVDTLAELKAALGYMMNARIDLETGCPKATAIKTISGGIDRVRAAIARAEPQP